VKVVRWRQADRLVLAALARRLPRPSWSMLVKPETVLRCHRELVRRKWATFARRPCRGRPSISEEYRELICQLAEENARWGYLRLKGELGKLGLEVWPAPFAGSCVGAASRPRHVAPPSPGAASWPPTPPTIVAIDSFSVDTAFLRRLYVLFFTATRGRALRPAFRS
jgi:putative transposase